MTQRPPSAAERLLAMPRFGDGLGLRRTRALLREPLESPWGQGFETLRVTGSNGKGSVTAMVHAVLRALGVACGRFTSPHLLRFHERIVVGDREVTDAELERDLAAVARRALALPGESFAAFEWMTAVCVEAFRHADLSLGVMEVGIGGRYDPTRLLPGALTALTSIDLEHAYLLGATRELIACDKLDLAPDGGTVVSFRRDDDLWTRMEAYCAVRRVELVHAGDGWQAEWLRDTHEAAPDGMSVRLAGGGAEAVVRLPLVGRFQLENLAVACALVERWVRARRPDVSPAALLDAVGRGLASLRWPGRLERISASPAVYIDVGHSPDACARAVEAVRALCPDGEILLVTGVSEDKSIDAILGALVPVATAVLCTRASHRGAPVERIAAAVRAIAPAREVLTAPTIEAAVATARTLAAARGCTVVVAGGLFLAMEFRAAWRGEDPDALRFF